MTVLAVRAASTAAFPTSAETPGPSRETEWLPGLATAGADKAGIFPADALKVGGARRVIREQFWNWVGNDFGKSQFRVQENIRGAFKPPALAASSRAVRP